MGERRVNARELLSSCSSVWLISADRRARWSMQVNIFSKARRSSSRRPTRSGRGHRAVHAAVGRASRFRHLDSSVRCMVILGRYFHTAYGKVRSGHTRRHTSPACSRWCRSHQSGRKDHEQAHEARCRHRFLRGGRECRCSWCGGTASAAPSVSAHVQRPAVSVNAGDHRWDHGVGYLLELGYSWDEIRGWCHDVQVEISVR